MPTPISAFAAASRRAFDSARADVGATVSTRVAEEIDAMLDRILPLVLEKLSSDEHRAQLNVMIEGIVNDVLPGILDEAIPKVLAQLSEDPEPIRELVWGQGAGMATELAGHVQALARDADHTVDNIARRLRLRRDGHPK
jgi:hypothetical protein